MCKSVCADCPQPRLLPDALPGAAAYSLCRTQWQHGPNGQLAGLRYADCMALLQLRHAEIGIAADELQQVIGDLQVIERAVMDARSEALAAAVPRHE